MTMRKGGRLVPRRSSRLAPMNITNAEEHEPFFRNPCFYEVKPASCAASPMKSC
jgi:hypothetical protein